MDRKQIYIPHFYGFHEGGSDILFELRIKNGIFPFYK